MKKLDIVCKKSDRILKVLQNSCPEINYSAFVTALRKKDIIVNGQRIKDNVTVFEGSNISCYIPDSSEKTMFSIVYSDENVVIVNKESGIEVCDGENNIEKMLKKDFPSVSAVHRLDRNTKGLVIFARNEETKNELIEATKMHLLHKYYLAEVVGTPAKQSQTLKGYLLKDKETAQVKVFQNKVPNSVEIITKYTVLKKGQQTSLLEVEISEGKTHQIRAHLAYVGLPILGDGKYGDNATNRKMSKKTQQLTAYKIIFELPSDSFLSYLNDKKICLSFDYLK